MATDSIDRLMTQQYSRQRSEPDRTYAEALRIAKRVLDRRGSEYDAYDIGQEARKIIMGFINADRT